MKKCLTQVLLPGDNGIFGGQRRKQDESNQLMIKGKTCLTSVPRQSAAHHRKRSVLVWETS